ncbi:uncharacterized protein V1510DRAFT_416869 [Dipodascopsis tothii]|uniref:uncharacterized protein n=1 Tax=Dipodascopsis tothii TaxID=44089 RepID=UPI0034CEA9AF
MGCHLLCFRAARPLAACFFLVPLSLPYTPTAFPALSPLILIAAVVAATLPARLHALWIAVLLLLYITGFSTFVCS